MTAPLDFSTVAKALPAFAFGLASRIGYEAFGRLHADMAGKPLDLDRVRELLGEKQADIVKRWPAAAATWCSRHVTAPCWRCAMRKSARKSPRAWAKRPLNSTWC